MGRYIENTGISFIRRPKRVFTDDVIAGEQSTTTSVAEQSVPDDILIEASKINAINQKFSLLERKINEITRDMLIPVDDGEVKKSVIYISNGADPNGDVIRQSTWQKSLDIKYATPSLIKEIPKYDFIDAIWVEIKIRICEWLKSITGVDTLIFDGKLQNIINGLKEDSIQSQMGMDTNGAPVTLDNISKVATNHSILPLTHADRILTYVNKKASEQAVQEYNTAAVDLKPAVDTLKASHENMVKIIEKSWGPFTYKRTDNGFDLSAPKVSSDRSLQYLRDNEKTLFNKSLKHTALDSTSFLLDKINISLDQYFSSSDLACCLFENVIDLSKLADKDVFKLLKGLRLALVYTFNGLNLQIGSQYNGMIDILNNWISGIMSSMIEELQKAVDGWLMNVRTEFNNYSKNKPSSWKRCYPFDEMMNVCLESLYQMENDLISYIDDFFNTLQLSHKNVDEYSINIKKRELIKGFTHGLDIIIEGIESGALCKVDGIEGNYLPLTSDEIRSYINNKNKRELKSPNELKNQAGISPSGTSLTNISDEDRMVLQDCNKSFTDNEIIELSKIINRNGGW